MNNLIKTITSGGGQKFKYFASRIDMSSTITNPTGTDCYVTVNAYQYSPTTDESLKVNNVSITKESGTVSNDNVLNSCFIAELPSEATMTTYGEVKYASGLVYFITENKPKLVVSNATRKSSATVNIQANKDMICVVCGSNEWINTTFSGGKYTILVSDGQGQTIFIPKGENITVTTTTSYVIINAFEI